MTKTILSHISENDRNTGRPDEEQILGPQIMMNVSLIVKCPRYNDDDPSITTISTGKVMLQTLFLTFLCNTNVSFIHKLLLFSQLIQGSFKLSRIENT